MAKGSRIVKPATLNIRGIDARAAERIKRAAAARDVTIGEYLARLVNFHDAMRALAEIPDNFAIAEELKVHGLETVRA